jgi:hypothetical protein
MYGEPVCDFIFSGCVNNFSYKRDNNAYQILSDNER